jgi:hypothetical protein
MRPAEQTPEKPTSQPCPCGSEHTEPANFYVSVLDRLSNDGSRDRFGVIAGPFATHAEALSMVEPAKRKAQEVDRRAHFYGFGTVAMLPTYTQAGVLNDLLGLREGAR